MGTILISLNSSDIILKVITTKIILLTPFLFNVVAWYSNFDDINCRKTIHLKVVETKNRLT